MQAVEAMTRLIAIADRFKATMGDAQSEEEQHQYEQAEVAAAVAQAMLNTALPVARWRCFVKFESGKEKGREFTLCAVNIEDIVVALYAHVHIARQVYVTLWEQRPTGADMVTGYQGNTRDYKKSYRKFIDALREYSSSTLAN